jgi:anthranilate phosphoribosyltransferase
MDGIDEVSTTGPTRISTLQHGRTSTDTFVPEDFNVRPAKIEDLAGRPDAAGNAAFLREVLSGEHPAAGDIVALNAAAGLIVADVAEGWHDGVQDAKRMIQSGGALRVLEDLVEFTQKEAA